jgi:hypothetical protein
LLTSLSLLVVVAVETVTAAVVVVVVQVVYSDSPHKPFSVTVPSLLVLVVLLVVSRVPSEVTHHSLL